MSRQLYLHSGFWPTGNPEEALTQIGMTFTELIPLENIQAARQNIAPVVGNTPLVRLDVEGLPLELYLKVESLNVVGSFKLRGATNALAEASPEQLAQGVYTASSGNMAQAVSWNTQRLGLECHVVVPDSAPEIKLQRIQKFGTKIIKVPFDEWWELFCNQRYPPLDGKLFIHPSSDAHVMAGYGSIALEVLEDLPDVSAMFIPWGSGGLCCASGSVMRPLKPDTRIFACEVDTGAPLAASFAAGTPTEVPYTPSFVDGISAPTIMDEMWPLARLAIDGVQVVTLGEICDAIRLVAAQMHLIIEGASAATVACAIKAAQEGLTAGPVVCVITGGNLDKAVLVRILQGANE
ncbi:MAG: pyridoxal-phosphate dependent enzyme [Anaerolineales bacterium]|nr:pyridoxal-phosphate dependent enzyme [Anaerolineales bacterium]